MRKIIERLLVFFVGIPVIVASVLFFPYYNYLLLNIEMLLFCALAVLEMRNMLSIKFPVYPVSLSLVAGLLIPVCTMLHTTLGLPFIVINFSIAIAICSVLFIEFILGFNGNFEQSLGRVGSAFTMILYPGYLMMYLTLMTIWQNAGYILSVFLLMVFVCDSFAWFFGVLFGKKNRGFFKASPNKSIAGFIGGYAGSILTGIAVYFIIPEIFPGSIWKMILLGFLTATASIVGDIIESIFKRSVGMKDSGHIVPGRGGVLDSIDSILLAAPVFYMLSCALFGF